MLLDFCKVHYVIAVYRANDLFRIDLFISDAVILKKKLDFYDVAFSRKT